MSIAFMRMICSFYPNIFFACCRQKYCLDPCFRSIQNERKGSASASISSLFLLSIVYSRGFGSEMVSKSIVVRTTCWSNLNIKFVFKDQSIIGGKWDRELRLKPSKICFISLVVFSHDGWIKLAVSNGQALLQP